MSIVIGADAAGLRLKEDCERLPRKRKLPRSGMLQQKAKTLSM